jgi:hypothetical protein
LRRWFELKDGAALGDARAIVSASVERRTVKISRRIEGNCADWVSTIGKTLKAVEHFLIPLRRRWQTHHEHSCI